jgi:hypothetical protein
MSIYSKIAEIRKALPQFRKDQEIGGIKFIGDEQLKNALLPLLNEHGVLVIPHGTADKDTFDLTLELVDLDSGDKMQTNMVFPIHERDYQFGGTITLAYKYILLILFNINTGEENGLNRALKKETPTLPKTVVKEIEDKTPDYDLGHDSMKEVEESKEEDFKKKYGIREPLSELPEVPETKVSVSTDKPNFAALFTEEKEVPTLPSIVETVEDIDDDIDEMPETVMDDPAPVIKANAANLEQKYQALENRIFEDPILESLPCHPKYIFEMQKGKRRTNKTYRELIIAFLTGGEPEFRAMLIQKYQLTPEDVINFATRVIAERELIPAVFKNTISEVDIDVPTKTPRDVTQYFKITEAINQLGISETQILDAIHLLQDTGKLEDKYRHEDKVHVPTFLINANKNDILLVLNETKR